MYSRQRFLLYASNICLLLVGATISFLWAREAKEVGRGFISVYCPPVVYVCLAFSALISTYLHRTRSVAKSGAATNPYITPHTLNSEVPDHMSQAKKDSPSLSSFVLYLCATAFVSFLCLMQYLALDYFVVRMRPYPKEANHYDWTMILFPVLPTVLTFAFQRIGVLKLTVGWCLSSIFLGLLLSIPLVGTLGIWFHFAIGGSL